MNKIAKMSVISVTAVVLGLGSLAAIASRGEHKEACEYGEHHERHGMMKYGKARFMDRNMDLSADEVKTLADAMLIMRGNERLKVGQVTQKDEQTYLVDIVTVDNSLVRQIEVDKDSGFKHKGYKHKGFKDRWHDDDDDRQDADS